MIRKTALILHGWPQSNIKSHFLCEYFEGNGYEVITPDMFAKECKFNDKNIADAVARESDNGLDIIIGISLGGLVVPFIAKENPDAKLVFIASGAKISSSSWFFNFLLRVFRNGILLYLIKPVLYLPDYILEFFYKLASPFNGTKEQQKQYIMDMKQNIKNIKNIPISKEKEILDFALQADNSQLLSKLGNKTLIFIGKNDVLMPQRGGEELHKLLQNSKLVVSNSEHFNTFTEDNLKQLDQFLV